MSTVLLPAPTGDVPPTLDAAFYTFLAEAITEGGPAPAHIVRIGFERLTFTLQLDTHITVDAMRTDLAWWGKWLGSTSVRVDHEWASHGGDKFTVRGTIEQAAVTVEVWNSWRTRPDDKLGGVSHLPLDVLQPDSAPRCHGGCSGPPAG